MTKGGAAPAEDSVAARAVPKARTGIRGLDDILEGGLPEGRITLLSGGPGTGKTVLAMEFVHGGAAAGEPGVFVCFEERADDLRANAAAMGMDLAAQEEAGALRVMTAEIPHRVVRAGEFDIHGLLAILDGHMQAVGARRVVLDAIDVLMRIFGDPQREREELHVLHDWLRDRGATAVITSKADPAGRQIYPFLDFLADCVLFLDQRMDRQVRTRRLRVVKYRGSGFLGNEHPYVLTPRGAVLMPVASMSMAQKTSPKRVSTGHATLDEILGGGYFAGSCILLAGPSGAGKTTLACTFVRDACRRGERVLYVDFEESAEALVDEMQSTGIDLRPALEDGTLRVLVAMPESAGIEQHLLDILDAIESFSPRHLVVDAISACRRMGSEPAAFDFLVRLLTACKVRGITVFYTNQVAELEQTTQISGSGISSLVDVLLAMQYVDDGERLRRRLVVIKSRGTKHSMRYHDFTIGDCGIALDGAERAERDQAAGDRP
ncbi:MAG: circadian clock protein KaiC [Phycisphaerae bacterium]